MDLNTIPKNISFGTNSPTIHTNKLFSDIIGKEISSIEVTTFPTEPEFTGSCGLTLDEQAAYIVGLRIRYHTEDFFTHNSLYFTSLEDYGIIEIRDYKDEIMEIHAPDVVEVVKGFIDDNILYSQEEFDLTDFNV